ncbi:cobalamin-dependent protein [Desulfitobacterium hafniense]|uniref:cobalamin B12-binding domain-containing protein n=1 Tax=Desulfitobacterium hafniense TaxID=49338 RepID=UPI00036B8CC0
MMSTSELQLITEALFKGQANRVKTLVTLALENGVSPQRILDEALLPSMQVIGEQVRNHEIYISDVLIASRAMHAGLYVLKPLLSVSRQSLLGKVVIGTVAGDLHDIGKNLVVMMLRGAGFEVIDLGVDVQPDDFAEAIRIHKPKVMALSAMLTTTLYMISETVHTIEQEGLRDQVKIIIGGRPATNDFARMIKADGFADDAIKAVDLVKQLVDIA